MTDQVLVGLGVLWGLVWLLSILQKRRKQEPDDTVACEQLLQFLLENRARFPNLLASNINPVLDEFRTHFRGSLGHEIRLTDLHTFAAQMEVRAEQQRSRKAAEAHDSQHISENEL
jgi:hypothetical protein